ncbi:MAG: ribose-phosphate pyrophosphokinase [Phycisphaeraceae bacterium]|nr:ribose-phosphate pyrophosphokinase [Phycisphaeraceae bacterium]
MQVFAGRHSKPLARLVCERLNLPLGDAKTSVFPDGEILVKLDEDVRGRDCFVLLSTCQPVNENLVELFIFMDTLKRASADRITAVIPYFGYGRQDRKDTGRVPITAKLAANLITKAGADRVLAVDLHAAQIQGFFDIPVDHLTAAPVFLDHFRSRREEIGDLCIVSPDVGNVKVAEKMANLLDADLAIINKRRVSGSEVVSSHIIGSVSGRTVIMFDDIISTGGTVCQAAKLLVEDGGASRVIVAATHAPMVGPAIERLKASPISSIVITNTIPLDGRADPIKDRLEVLSVSNLLGDAIHNIHHDLSISALFRDAVGPKR